MLFIGSLFIFCCYLSIEQYSMRTIFFLAFTFIFSGIFAQQQLSDDPETAKTAGDSFDPSAFDKYVQQAVKDWDAPGLAIVVVKDDEVIFEKGYGLREVGKTDPVDPETLFAIASTTKAFTAAAIGMLVDEGKIKWDDPVVKHLPEFKLRDSQLSSLITIRDLLTHRAGLPNTDFLWNDPETSTAEILQRLEFVEAAYPQRSGFIYQNIMYAVAGEVIEAVSGKSWEEFIRTRIFEPLKMERSSTSRAGLAGADNVASPHDYVGEELQPVQGSFADAIGPAGSMWSSVAEMSRWMRFLLNGCETETGESLLEEKTCEELFRPQVVLSQPSYPTSKLVEPNWETYGLGWFQQDYEGRKVDFHTGSLSGMVAIAGMIRDENLGVYILSNRDHVEVRHALMYRVFDLFDEDPPRDWSSELKILYDDLGAEQKKSGAKNDLKINMERASNTKPSLPLENYTGTYKNELYGTVEITKNGKVLQLKYGGLTGNLEHWHYNTFRLTNDKPESSYRPLVNFDLTASGKVEGVSLGGARKFEKE